jgi:mannose-1-phosphate guanylyltransferase
VQAIILVGGEGTRLRPLTYEMPKQMLPLLGTPMIERVFASMAEHGVTEIILSLGYLPDSFVAAYPEGRIGDVKITYVTEPEPLDTAGAIRFAATQAGVTETFFVVNGDVLTDLNLTSLLAFHRQQGAEATIALHPVEDPSRFGVVPTDDDGRVLAFVEKPPRDEAPTNLINAGTYIFEPSVLNRIAPEGRVSIERETFPALAADGVLFAMPDNAYWLDTGTPIAFLQANTDLIASSADGVIDANWIHPDAFVDASAVVTNSVIDRDCRIGAEAVITRSVLLPGVRVDDAARIEDSIIGTGAHIGTGAVLSATCVVEDHYEVPAHASFAGEVRLSNR